jgi:hypothetical protein
VPVQSVPKRDETRIGRATGEIRPTVRWAAQATESPNKGHDEDPTRVACLVKPLRWKGSFRAARDKASSLDDRRWTLCLEIRDRTETDLSCFSGNAKEYGCSVPVTPILTSSYHWMFLTLFSDSISGGIQNFDHVFGHRTSRLVFVLQCTISFPEHTPLSEAKVGLKKLNAIIDARGSQTSLGDGHRHLQALCTYHKIPSCTYLQK